MLNIAKQIQKYYTPKNQLPSSLIHIHAQPTRPTHR
jgi:hypothetical protein